MIPEEISELTKQAFDMIEPFLKEHGLEAVLITAVPQVALGMATTELDYETMMSMLGQTMYHMEQDHEDDLNSIAESN